MIRFRNLTTGVVVSLPAEKGDRLAGYERVPDADPAAELGEKAGSNFAEKFDPPKRRRTRRTT